MFIDESLQNVQIGTIPKSWGYMLHGDEEIFIKAIQKAINDTEGWIFNYVEIGIADSQTLKGITDYLLSLSLTYKCWATIGIDIPEGWEHLHLRYSEINLGNLLYKIWKPVDSEVTMYSKEIIQWGKASILLRPCQDLLNNYWNIPIFSAFIDACHGKACGMGDFLAIEQHIVNKGIVIFHDSDEIAQGVHMQAHCKTGIAIRAALIELGLLQNERPGWRMLADISALPDNHGIAVFQHTEE